MKRYLLTLVFALASALAQAQTPPLCYASQVGGSGTKAQWQRVNTDPGAANPSAAYVLWWWCPTKVNWQFVPLMCEVPRLGECLASLL